VTISTSGRGAEIGFYSHDGPVGNGTGQWAADQNGHIPKMSMSVRGVNTGQTIASFAPQKPQVWVAQWNPNVQNQSKNDLAATMTVDFSDNPGLLAAFRLRVKGNNEGSWLPDNKTAMLRFRRRKGGWAR
jgi:hypothetical protein